MKKKIFSTDQILLEFNNRSRLSQLISKYVQLELRGNSHVGRCPFHEEKTPSFSVNDEKGLFYCFGCKVGGNAITFLKKYNNFSFLESIKFLSNYLGLDLNFENTLDENINKKKFEILETANNFFKFSLKKNNSALNYLVGRGINSEIQEIFHVGFCPSDEDLINYFKKKEITKNDLFESDLLIKNKQNQFFGRFRNRITFPIFNFGNKIVGFGGRTINESKIKYINSQESDIFKKGDILFGLKQNFDHIRKFKEIILVEGYMDVIAMNQFNIKTSVSSLGTTLSKNQAMKIWSYTDTPYLCFDGDNAGRLASKNIAMKVLEYLEPGKTLRIIKLPNNEDPDSFLSKNSSESFEELKSKSVNLSNVIWNIIKNSIPDLSPEFIVKFDEKIKFFANKIKNKAISGEYFKFLNNQKTKYLWEHNSIKSFKPKKKNQKVFEDINEKLMLTFIFFEKEIIDLFVEEISKLKLTKNIYEKIKNQILQEYSSTHEEFKNFKEKFKEYNKLLVDEFLSLKELHLKNLDMDSKSKLFKQIINNLKLPELDKEKEEIKNKIVQENNSERQRVLIARYDEIIKEIKFIRNKELE